MKCSIIGTQLCFLSSDFTDQIQEKIEGIGYDYIRSYHGYDDEQYFHEKTRDIEFWNLPFFADEPSSEFMTSVKKLLAELGFEIITHTDMIKHMSPDWYERI